MSRPALRIGTLIWMAGTLIAQRNYTPADVEDGSRLYRANCMVCHGPEGDAISGVDLGHGKFRRASSDADLIRIIRSGIQGTAMPPNNFSEFQASTIVAHLRSMAAATTRATSTGGNAVRGKALFEGKGACTGCHRIRANGSRVGPDLSDIGMLRRAPELEQSIVDPNAEVLPQNRFVRVVTRDGATTTGRLLNEDTFTVQVLDSKERLLAFARSDLREYTFVEDSPMPSYKDKLSAQELADLVAYLVSQKGVDAQ